MSAKVIETTFTPRQTLKWTSYNGTIPMKEVPDGTEVEYSGYIIQEICNEKTGEVFESILLVTASGDCYATRSEFFRNTLRQIIDCINDFCEEDSEPILIRIVKAKSKKGNEFMTCELV